MTDLGFLIWDFGFLLTRGFALVSTKIPSQKSQIPNQTMFLSIRKAVAADFSAIDEFDMFAGDRQEEISRGECFVAVDNEVVVGYLTTARTFYQCPFIAYVQVRDALQGQGIGTALLAFAEARWPVEKIYTSTEADNLPMLHLLQKRGYSTAGEILFIQHEPELVFCLRR